MSDLIPASRWARHVLIRDLSATRVMQQLDLHCNEVLCDPRYGGFSIRLSPASTTVRI